MTIKLLTPRDLTIGGRTVTYPAGALVTLDSATETGLINSKEATATLTGGITYTPPTPSGQPVPVMAIPSPSSGGVEFDAPTTDAIIAIAGDASSGNTAQIVDGYPVEVTGTSEVLVSAVPCDIVWIAHNGVTGTITVRDAGVTGTGVTAAKTIDMATTATLQPGSLRTQFGVTATLTAGKATFWVRPL